jgi:hypothetical protein
MICWLAKSAATKRQPDFIGSFIFIQRLHKGAGVFIGKVISTRYDCLKYVVAGHASQDKRPGGALVPANRPGAVRALSLCGLA